MIAVIMKYEKFCVILHETFREAQWDFNIIPPDKLSEGVW